MLQKLNNPWLIRASLIGLAVFASVSISRTVTNALQEPAGVDLHTYWYYNHFIRQGDDPYEAYHYNRAVRLPVKYVDGRKTTSYPLSSGVELLHPANTPITLFLLYPFSYLSWPTAKLVWMVFNLGTSLATPWVVFRLLPMRPSLAIQGSMALIFYGMVGARATVASGQTTLVVFVLMLLTYLLVRDGKRWLPGILLGVALSKFSVAIPLLLLLLYKREWRVVIIAFALQVMGFAGIALLRWGSPIAVLSDYATIAALHRVMPGIHLTGWFTPSLGTSAIVAVLFTLAVFVPLWKSVVRYRVSNLDSQIVDFATFATFTILCLWSLLVAYHRAYDTGVAFLVLVLIVTALVEPGLWQARVVQMNQLLLLFLASVVVLSLPYVFLIPGDFSAWWGPLVRGATTVDLLLLLAASILWLRQFEKVNIRSLNK